MWLDKKLYWEWVGKKDEIASTPLPSIKRLDYVVINKGRATEFKLCIGVWDDEKHTPLHRDELEFHLIQYS